MDTLEDLYYGSLFPHEKSVKLDNETKNCSVCAIETKKNLR